MDIVLSLAFYFAYTFICLIVIHSYVRCPLALLLFNSSLDVNIYVVYSLSIIIIIVYVINFDGLGSFHT